MKKFLLAFLTLAGMTGYQAQALDGNGFVSWCMAAATKENVRQNSACTGYVAALVDSARFQEELSDGGTRVCLPPRASHEQLKKVVLEYLDNNPEILHENAAGIALIAWGEVYACK